MMNDADGAVPVLIIYSLVTYPCNNQNLYILWKTQYYITKYIML